MSKLSRILDEIGDNHSSAVQEYFESIDKLEKRVEALEEKVQELSASEPVASSEPAEEEED